MALKLISKEKITPSNPTPHHLRNFKISLIDQITPSFYIPLVLFYPSNQDQSNNTSEIISHLKKSLAKTLNQFYPLAGKMKDCITIDCNDSGVTFIVGHMGCHLDDILRNPNLDSMCDFVPFKTNCFQDTTQGFVGIQVTTFDCGGVVVGLCMHHSVGDAASTSNFIKSWAEEAFRMRKGGVVTSADKPDLTTGPELFPPVESAEKAHKIVNDYSFNKTPLVQRRYVFDKNAITSLQAKAYSKATPKPTRNTVLTSFLWKHFTEASRAITASPFTSVVSVLVNIRPRLNPPLPSNCHGNLLSHGSASIDLSTDEKDIPDISQLSHDISLVVSRVDSDFLAKMQEPGVILKMAEEVEGSMIEGVKVFKFSNWCNMGHYGIDFGWGSPKWVTFAHKNDMLNNECNVFMDSPSRSGIEVYLIAEEPVISVMEKNQEFLEFASINPSVISD